VNTRKSVIFILQSVIFGLAVAFLALWLNPAWIPDRGVPMGGLAAIPDAVRVSAPAVVNIYSTRFIANPTGRMRQRLGLGGGLASRRLVTSLGSGVIIDPAGYIVTNHHVIAAAEDIKIQLADGRVTEPEIVGIDVETDLAVLKMNLPDLPVMTLGRSDQLQIGEIVLAIGNPYGLSQTVTQGIISATGRTQLGLSRFENFIQTDAAINIGNSGGALVNLRGELVGINTAVLGGAFDSDGIGFAIPVNLMRGVAEQLQKHGRVRRGWLGIVPRDLTTSRAAALKLAIEGGVELVQLYRDSPALEAGLRPGDIITHMNDQPIQVSRQALNIVAALMPGDQIELRGIRAGQPFSVVITLAERPTA
jgi:S1-C subfamily serine protease